MTNEQRSIRFLTPSEIAETLTLAPATVYNLINSGELKAARIGRSLRVDPQDFEAYINQCKEPGMSGLLTLRLDGDCYNDS